MLSARFTSVIAWFAGKMADEAHRRRMDSPVQPAIWSYLHRQARRFAALVAKWQAGTLPAARPPRKRPAPDPTAVRQPRPAGVSSRRSFSPGRMPHAGQSATASA